MFWYNMRFFTELTEISCTGIKVSRKIQNLSGTVWEAYRKTAPAIGHIFKSIPALQIRANILYSTHITVGYRYGRLTELTERVG